MWFNRSWGECQPEFEPDMIQSTILMRYEENFTISTHPVTKDFIVLSPDLTDNNVFKLIS